MMLNSRGTEPMKDEFRSSLSSTLRVHHQFSAKTDHLSSDSPKQAPLVPDQYSCASFCFVRLSDRTLALGPERWVRFPYEGSAIYILMLL